MKCEICNLNEAIVHFKHVMDSEVRELNICEACAVENGLSVQPPDLISDFLLGKAGKPLSVAAKPEVERKCSFCGMKDSDFSNRSRLGCGECYDSFKDEVENIVGASQSGSRHAGKVPGGKRAGSHEDQLTALMNEAVAAQNYEEAARIRDMIESCRLQGCEAGNVPV